MKRLAPRHLHGSPDEVSDHRVEILILGHDVELRRRSLVDGLPEVKREREIEGVASGGADLDEFDLAGQPVDLPDEGQIEFLLVLPDEQRDVDRFALDEPEIDVRDILKVHEHKVSEGGVRHKGKKAIPSCPRITRMSRRNSPIPGPQGSPRVSVRLFRSGAARRTDALKPGPG